MSPEELPELNKIIFVRKYGVPGIVAFPPEIIKKSFDQLVQWFGHDAATARSSSFSTSALHDGHFRNSPRFCENFTTMYGDPQVSHTLSMGLSHDAKSHSGYRDQ